MQENIQRYHPLGTRTLVMLIVKKSGVFLVLLALLLVGVFLLSYVPARYINIAVNVVLGYLALVVAAAVAIICIGWLQYFRYWIFVDDKDLKIARGLIATEQIGIPYRHIQDIKIERSLIDQLFGVSDIVITVLDPEEGEPSKEDNTIVLSSLSKDIALQIQDIVLKKAQVQQVNILPGQK